jgi:hypothetical protein
MITPDIEGGYTKHFPSGEEMSIYDAAMRTRPKVPLVVFAGKEYGTGSSRDWAAKGTKLLGRPRGDRRELRAHPPLEPGRHGRAAAAVHSVDYWDYLGWKDTFAKPSLRRASAPTPPSSACATCRHPQVVVDGREAGLRRQGRGGRGAGQDAAKARANPPDMEFVGDRRVAVGSGPAPRGGGEVWLVRYDPREQEVAVKRGDNRGQTLVHRNVVRELTRLGPGRPAQAVSACRRPRKMA